MKTTKEIKNYILTQKERSAWKKGVKEYSFELLENLEGQIENGYLTNEIFESPKLLDKAMLNGAENWSQYSWGGCSLIYDGDIAERLCTPSELKRTRNGERKPNRNEEWLDVQTRALYQAAIQIKNAIAKI